MTKGEDQTKRVGNYRHGFKTTGKYTPEYAAWNSMRARCHNHKNPRFKTYGARGIEVCARWRRDFLSFLGDVGRRPSPDHSIERRDNNRGYEPGNCVWATRKRQARNRSSSRIIEAFGKSQPSAAWAEEYGITQAALHARLKLGWSPEDAISRPIGSNGRKRMK